MVGRTLDQVVDDSPSVEYSDTFSDRFPTNDAIEAIDAKRDRDLNARPRR